MSISNTCQLKLRACVVTWHTYRMGTATRYVELVACILRELAERRGLSGAEIARRSGVSQAQISRIFTGKRTISVDHVLAVAEVLGVRGSDVFAEAERRFITEDSDTQANS